MSARTSHGSGKAKPIHIEVRPVDEMDPGVPAPLPAEGVAERLPGGQWAKGCKTVQSAGGKARKGQTALTSRPLLGAAFADPRFDRFQPLIKSYDKAQRTEIARSVGGGVCCAAASGFVASGALELGASRFAFEVLNDLALGSRLACASRQNILAAYEVAARFAKSNQKPGGLAPGLEQFFPDFAGAGK